MGGFCIRSLASDVCWPFLPLQVRAGVVAGRTSAAEVGRVVGDMQAAGQIGGTIGPLIGGVVAGELGLPAAFFASSLVGLSAIVVVGLFVRPDATRHRALVAGPARGSL